ncbi:MAG: TolC family protein [Armatimonadetes bacterium]|nr:TolC family protein [Armatimonadota bacterium]
MKLILSTIIMFTAAFSLGAEKLNLSHLSADALKNHPRIAAMKADRDATKARRDLSLVQFQPKVSLNGYAATGSGSMIFPSSVDPANYSLLPSDNTGVANATLMWNLFAFGRDRDVASAGSFEVLSAESAIQTESLEVLFNLRTAFADALFKKDSLAGYQAALESAKEVERTTQARLDAGKVPLAFALRARADTAKAEQELVKAQADSESTEAKVWEAAGHDQGEENTLGDWDLKADAPKDLKTAIAIAWEKRPEVAVLKFQLSAAHSRQSAIAKSKLPELNFMAMNDLMGASGVRGSNTSKAGLVLSFPLGDGGQRNAESKEQKAMITRLEAEEKALRNRVSSEVAQSWAEWKAVEPMKTAAQAELLASDEGYRVAIIRYEEGKSILAELTDYRSQLTYARLSVAEADGYERKAWSKLARAIGQ